MQPSVWGPALWRSLHIVALGYPDNCADEATRDMVRYDYKQFYENFWRVIPCKKCSVNYRQHLQELPPIDNYLSCRNDLFTWTVALHNIVNKELGKREYSVEEAREFYKSPVTASPVVVPAPAIRIFTDSDETQIQKAATANSLGFISHNITIMSLILIIIILIVFIITNKRG